MTETIIRQVWENKGSKQLLVTLPKDKVKKGDYVKIVVIEGDDSHK